MGEESREGEEEEEPVREEEGRQGVEVGGQALCLRTFRSTFLLLLNNGEGDGSGDPRFRFVSWLKT